MREIYLDHAATTPVRSEVRAAMDPYLSEAFGNPSSAHGQGRRARAALEDARARIAEVLGARPQEIVFVRGGTESDNLAVRGRARAVRREGRQPRLAVSAVEHHAVLEAAAAEAREGADVRRIGVDASGTPNEDELDAALEGEPDLLSLMWVNNEVGTVLPVAAVAERARERGIPVHSDAVQAVGKIPVRVDEVPVDLLTVTGHKIYGPKGMAILFVREGTELAPGLFGGGQERGLRPGTPDVAGAVGLAEAIALAVEEREEEAGRLAALRDALEEGLAAAIPGLRVHGAEGRRAPHVSNVGVPGVNGEGLLMGMDMEGVAVSGGSACESGTTRTSHVLEAMHGTEGGFAPLRFSLGRETDRSEVDAAVEATLRVVERLGAE